MAEQAAAKPPTLRACPTPGCGRSMGRVSATCQRCYIKRRRSEAWAALAATQPQLVADGRLPAAWPGGDPDEKLEARCTWSECPAPERRIVIQPKELASALKRRDLDSIIFYHSPKRDGADAPNCAGAAGGARLSEHARTKHERAFRKVTCANCGLEFERPDGQIKEGRPSYCNRECNARGKQSRLTLRCRECHQESERQPAQVLVLKSYDESTRTYICRRHPDLLHRPMWDRRKKPLAVRCRDCGSDKTTVPCQMRQLKSFDPVTNTYRCRDHAPTEIGRPCSLPGCKKTLCVNLARRSVARYCSAAHKYEGMRALTRKVFPCGRRRQLTATEATRRRYCDLHCSACRKQPERPTTLALGPQMRRERSVARYWDAIRAGARTIPEIRAASGLVQRTISKYRRELGLTLPEEHHALP